ADEEVVVLAGKFDVLGPLDVLGEIPPSLDAKKAVLAAVHHERRDLDLGEQRPHVLFEPGPYALRRGVGGARKPLTPSDPFTEAVVATATRRGQIYNRPGTPRLASRRGESIHGRRRQAPGALAIAEIARVGAVQDECAHTVGMRGN